MKANTKEGDRLKRMAVRYARAYAEETWIGSRHPDEHQEVLDEFKAAKKALFDAIDELTAVDLTPRAVSEQ